MKNIMYALVGLCLLAGPVFGQAQVAEIATAAVKKAVKTAPKRVIIKAAKKTPAVEKKAVNISSKVWHSRAELSGQNIAALQSINQQKAMQVMLQDKLTHAQKVALIEQIKQESAVMLKDLTERYNKETFAYGEALYRERNSRFLPAKEKDIPGMFALSADPARYANISPRYFTEFIDLIPQYGDLPEPFTALVAHLSRNLLKLDKKMLDVSRRLVDTERYISVSVNMAEKGRLIGTRNRLNKELTRYSKEAAQNMTDLVYLLNTYPSAYEGSLTMLATKLDKTFQTPFTKFLRSKVKVETPKTEIPRRRIGFSN